MKQTLFPSYCMVSSDAFDQVFPFQARILGDFVREQKILSLMDAIYKCATLPALRLGLSEKGRIACGLDADLTLFNPETVQGEFCLTDFSKNEVHGIDYVIVNGKIAADHGKILNTQAGSALRHRPYANYKPSWMVI